MQEFLNIALGFPTIVWTALLGLVAFYWLFVILGAVDLELFDIDIDLDLETDLDIDLDADFDADVDMDADVDADADADVDGAASSASPFAKVAVALGIGRVPITILFTFFTLSGWAMSYFGTLYLTPMLKLGAIGAVILGATFVLAVPVMGALAHPLKGLFQTKTRRAGSEVIGQVCIIMTGSVDESFGQARLDDGGAGLLLNVRCESENDLGRHDQALIIGHERETDIYFVEPYKQFLASDDAETAASPEVAEAKDWVNATEEV